MPVSTWLGQSDAPGQAASLGPLDAYASRDLAAALAASTQTRWCLTLTAPDGRALGHGCARASPGPGPPPPGSADWLRSVKISWLECGECTHQRQSSGYRPSASLRHLIKIRHRTCAFPGCRRQAYRCDDDHTLAHDQGGRTCECNLAPLCRRHHQAKQAPAWHLDQPEPGILVWTLPHGRRYTVMPGTYPA
jgi:hypothetical protein